jgi:phage tail sheath protein FI
MTMPQLAPGVRVREVSPGGPIAGVGTSTAAFVGTTLRGQPDSPRMVLSWDAFRREFGDGGSVPSPTRWFARAVHGFFVNGGVAAYILRVSSGVQAQIELPSRQVAPTPDPALSAIAIREGAAGNGLTVQVKDSSLLADRLTAAGAPAGTSTLTIVTQETEVKALTDARRVLEVSSSAGFAAGDRVQVRKAALTSREATILAVEGPGTLRLQNALGGTGDFAGGTVRVKFVPAGSRELMVTVPSGLRLSDGVPTGTLITLTASGGVDETHVVVASGARSVTLARPIGTRLDVTAAQAPALASMEFTLVITGGSPSTETFAFLSTTPGHPRHWATAVTSDNVRLAEPAAPPAGVIDPRPAAGVYPLKPGTNDDPDAAWAQIVSNADTLEPLTRLDDVSIVCVPGLTSPTSQQALINHCEAERNRVAILDPPPRCDLQQILAHRQQLQTTPGYGALYYPNILVRNTLTGTNDLQPPSGHLAGVYARSDQLNGVHKAPANEVIAGAVALELTLTDGDQAQLNDGPGINGIRSFKGGPPLVWGARTLAVDRSFQFVNVRRLMIFVEESLRTSLREAVFAPNDLRLWKRLDRTIRAFLTRVWRDGALFGATPDDAFTVQIDELNNPEEDRRNGILNIWIFVRPTYTAEHILVQIGLLVDDAQ